MKFLIIQLGRIGDMILVTPMIRALAEKFADATIDIVAGRHNYSVVDNNPRLRKILVYEKSPLKLIGFIRSLRSEKYDRMLDPKDHFSTESKYLALLSRADKKAGFNKPGKKIFDYGIPSSKETIGQHYVQKCFNPLHPLGIEMPSEIPRPELFTKESSDQYVGDFLKPLGPKPMIAVNISASRSGKMWANEKWQKALEVINYEKYSAVLTFAPENLDRALDLSKRRPELHLFKSRSMADATSLISRSSLLITPDTSLVHVAAAFDRPLVGLYSSNRKMFEKFHPLSSKYIAVRACEGDDGISSITPEQTAAAIKKILD